jgi:methionyl-tRNA formyltransferase
MNKLSCALLLSDHAGIADSAEAFGCAAFDVRYVVRRSRWDNKVDSDMEAAFSQNFDCLLNFLCPVILPERLLAKVRGPAVNFHPAPPEWPGIGSPSLALYHGETTFGATAHLMIGKADAGEILKVVRFPIFPHDSCQSLFARSLDHALLLLYDVGSAIATGQTPVPTGETWKRAAFTRRQFEEWMTLAPDASAEEIQRKVRAVRHPKFPGPFVKLGGYRFELPPGIPDFGAQNR